MADGRLADGRWQMADGREQAQAPYGYMETRLYLQLLKSLCNTRMLFWK